ncbi:MAG: pyridoxal-phosphate dependent enzyme [bacterium]|jgi:cysteine synthase
MPSKEQVLENTVKRCRERNIIIPTYEEMRDPEKVPAGIKKELKDIGLWDLHPRNLFRITWKNEPIKHGGGFGGVNYFEIPCELSGVKARIFVLIGKFFPTGAHKVGATFGPLVEKLVRGEFDPTTQKALWPSTGNYCRGGAYDAYLLACPSIAVMPEGMSQERFDYLKKVGSEIYPTPGTESNVKEVYDKTHELKNARPDEIVVLNQFDEFGNSIWHYAVTGPAMEEVFAKEMKPSDRFSAIFLTQGSAGTLGCADYIREKYPSVKVCAGEAMQCPTLLYNGYGEHRIEGIGDKHVPWIHNIRNMDMVAGIDDEQCVRLIRLFNEEAGKRYMKEAGVPAGIADRLDLFGISSVANLIGAIKMARYYEMNENDCILTVATDSMELYQSRIMEMRKERGEYSEIDAATDFDACLMGQTIDHMLELPYWERKRIHNLKYFTWIEQQGKTVEELNAQWHDRDYWKSRLNSYREWDERIREFNERTGLLKEYE